MKTEKALKVIRDEIEKEGMKVLKIILFGSRARGDFREDSDWDLLVVIDKDLPLSHKREILGNIYKMLAEVEGESYEVIITSQRKYEELKNFVGTLMYDAEREGVLLWS